MVHAIVSPRNFRGDASAITLPGLKQHYWLASVANVSSDLNGRFFYIYIYIFIYIYIYIYIYVTGDVHTLTLYVISISSACGSRIRASAYAEGSAL